MTVGKLIRNKRLSMGLTLDEVYNATGISNLCRYERNESNLSFSTAVKLAKYLDIDIKKLAKYV